MFQATKSSTPASTASGTCTASGAATRTIASSVAAWTMPATGLVAPARTLVTVRAIVPVAGMPPKNGATMLAMPCAISSWFGSWRLPVVRPSATRAHSSDSTAPRSAIVTVGTNSRCTLSQSKSGQTNAGSERGMPPKRLPMVSTGSPSQAATSVSETRATIGPGVRVASRITRRACVDGRATGGSAARSAVGGRCGNAAMRAQNIRPRNDARPRPKA